MLVTRAQLAELVDKYRVLAALRERRESLEREGHSGIPDDERASRREAMAQVAARFPGALRELDTFGSDEISQRIDALESCLSGQGEAPQWAQATAMMHVALREALALRRGEALSGAFWPADDDTRARLIRPPSGRLLDETWAALGARLGVSGEEAQSLVFGAATAGACPSRGRPEEAVPARCGTR